MPSPTYTEHFSEHLREALARRSGRRRRVAAIAVLATMLSAVVGMSRAEAAPVPMASACPGPDVRCYVPPGSGNPFGVTAGPGGTWVANGNSIDLIPAAGGGIVRYRLPEGKPAVVGWLAYPGSGDAVWFATRGTGRLGTVASDGTITEYQVPDGAAGPASPGAITFAADGAVYFTDSPNDRVGRYDPAGGTFSFWSVPTADSWPLGLVLGADGDFYFTERSSDKVGRLDPATGSFTEWTLTPGAFPNRLAVTPDGSVWFTELRTDQIGRIDTTGHLSELAMDGGPVGMTYAGGYLYVVQYGAAQLAQLDLTGTVVRTWDLPGAQGVLQVAASHHGAWVTDGFGTLLYRVALG